MKTIMCCLVGLSLCIQSHAETAWELKKDQDGIKVYTGSLPNSNLKAIKVTCELDATLSQLAALLLDVKAHEKWVYNTRKSYLLKQESATKLLYYSEVDMPWPLSNRDLVIELSISQQPITKVMYVDANAVDHYVAIKNGMVRVPSSSAHWIVTPIAGNKLSIEYTGQADPGGGVPVWLANSFSTKGPFETFKKLKELVSQPEYRDAKCGFVME